MHIFMDKLLSSNVVQSDTERKHKNVAKDKNKMNVYYNLNMNDMNTWHNKSNDNNVVLWRCVFVFEDGVTLFWFDFLSIHNVMLYIITNK